MGARLQICTRGDQVFTQWGQTFCLQKFIKQLLSFFEAQMTLENEVALEPSEYWGGHPPGTAVWGWG